MHMRAALLVSLLAVGCARESAELVTTDAWLGDCLVIRPGEGFCRD